MVEDLNFIDLVALSRIKPDTVVEKFGGIINSSFFDASNILGSLKQKGLIDFTTAFPGQSSITITDLGKQTLQESEEKAKEDFDALDFAIITQLSGGKRGLADLGGAVNVRQKDLAMHLYKLSEQQYVSYSIRNGNIDISLTEKGFLQVKSGMPKPKQVEAQNIQVNQVTTQQEQQAIATQSAEAQQAQQGTQSSIEQLVEHAPKTDLEMLEANMLKAKRNSIYMIIGITLVIVVFIVMLLLLAMKII
ncbi:MAG: hypothetical protein ACP5TL_01865 [Candidatus Micrarchaeia archaeon]